jgi:Rps23 Pro-64 3,4-dihydroxylase Tpa1-like proline 4-hydroxylase
MDLKLHKKPFPHIVIDNFFTHEEYSEVWKEIMFLSSKMRPPDETGGAKDRGIPMKKGMGVFIESFFQDYHDSNIFKYSKKLFQKEYVEAICSSDFFYLPYKGINVSTATLVQVYRNGDYYLPHKDNSLYTAVTLIHKEPREYSGGEFYFAESNHVVELHNNQTIIFPSIVDHGVSEVKLLSNEIQDARFTISQLLYIAPNTNQ